MTLMVVLLERYGSLRVVTTSVAAEFQHSKYERPFDSVACSAWEVAGGGLAAYGQRKLLQPVF